MIRHHRCYCCEMDYRICDIDHLLCEAVDYMAYALRGRKLQEPDYTAAITTQFVRLIHNYHWDALDNARVGGSFIHQRPIVTFDMNGQTQQRELGDLLILCRKTIDGRQCYNAALMQLKMAHNSRIKTIHRNSTEFAQLYLYTHWPIFTCASGTQYDIYPKTITQGAQYMFVNKDDIPVFTHSKPRQDMKNDAYLSFGRFLYDFVRWQNGRSIEPEDRKEKDFWSKLIWDILDHNARAYFNRRNVGLSNEQRNVMAYLNIIMNHDFNHSENLDYYDNHNEATDFPLACPILFFDIDNDEHHEIDTGR